MIAFYRATSFVFVTTLCVLLLSVTSWSESIVPLPHAHAHNDYRHDRPLLDALDHGFCSIEADIWLVDGKLLVAHDLHRTSPDRTLQGLYLEPLRERVRENGGRVYPGGPEIILLVDIKSDAESTYRELHGVLQDYEEMLTTVENGVLNQRAVRVIVSGNRPRDLLAEEEPRLAAYDGRPDDLDSEASAQFIPLISASWLSEFEWRGRGPIPDADRQKLERIVGEAHAQGRIVRFWAIPHSETFWETLLDVGVDLINADDLPRLRDFLLSRR